MAAPFSFAFSQLPTTVTNHKANEQMFYGKLFKLFQKMY